MRANSTRARGGRSLSAHNANCNSLASSLGRCECMRPERHTRTCKYHISQTFLGQGKNVGVYEISNYATSVEDKL